MGTTQPIRDAENLTLFIDYYKNVHPNLRNYTLIQLDCTQHFESATCWRCAGRMFSMSKRENAGHTSASSKKDTKTQ